MTDITSANVKPVGGSSAPVGRSSDIWGRRPIGLYRINLTSSAPAGGFTFDPATFGFQGPIGAVFISRHSLVANFPAMNRYSFEYDFVNKKIVPKDATDAGDDAAGDDLSTITLDVIVVGE